MAGASSMVIAGRGSACSARSQCRSTYRPRTWRRIDPTAKSEPVCRSVRTILVQPPGVTVSSESTKVTRSPVDSAMPRLRAAPRPALSWRTTRTRGSRSA
nr:hypothetical protein [Nocardioides panacis]